MQHAGWRPRQHTHLHDFGQDGLVEVVFECWGTEVPLVHLLVLILSEEKPAQPVPVVGGSGAEVPANPCCCSAGAAAVPEVPLTYCRRWRCMHCPPGLPLAAMLMSPWATFPELWPPWSQLSTGRSMSAQGQLCCLGWEPSTSHALLQQRGLAPAELRLSCLGSWPVPGSATTLSPLAVSTRAAPVHVTPHFSPALPQGPALVPAHPRPRALVSRGCPWPQDTMGVSSREEPSPHLVQPTADSP